MFEKYAQDYYMGKKTTSDILKEESIDYWGLYEIMKNEGFTPYRSICNNIETNDKSLKKLLRGKYAHITLRCRGGSTDTYGHYLGMDYLSIIEWVDFCNKNMARIEKLWGDYLNSGKSLKFAVSIDRINNEKGYLIDNMEFVTHGYNSWKRSAIRPVMAKLRDECEWGYFMSCQEAGRRLGIRFQDLGEILAGNKYVNKKYQVKLSNEKDVLMMNNVETLEDYYNKYYIGGLK